MPGTVTFHAVGRAIPVPVEQAAALLARIGEPALRESLEHGIRRRVVDLGPCEKAAVLDAIESWLQQDGIEAVGYDLFHLRAVYRIDLRHAAAAGSTGAGAAA